MGFGAPTVTDTGIDEAQRVAARLVPWKREQRPRPERIDYEAERHAREMAALPCTSCADRPSCGKVESLLCPDFKRYIRSGR